jgi:hypothetical protein
VIFLLVGLEDKLWSSISWCLLGQKSMLHRLLEFEGRDSLTITVVIIILELCMLNSVGYT